MGVRFPSVATNTFIGPLPASVAETVVLTTPPLTLPLDFSQVILVWMCQITAGTGTTFFAWKLRRGTSITGAAIGLTTWNTPATVASGFLASGVYIDTPGAVAGQQYSLTVQQQGATAAGTFTDGCLVAFVL